MNKKIRTEYWREYNEKNAEKISKYQVKYRKDYQKSLIGRYANYRNNAKTRGLIFKLTFKEFELLVKDHCVYCGGEGFGVDRINNFVGYLKNNVVPCCTKCNKMKLVYTAEEFIEHCKKIAKFNI